MFDGREMGVRIAFGDRPGNPVRTEPADGPRARWLAAVALGAQGWYAAAAALLDETYRRPDAPRALRAHAAVTRAAHLRQLGGHQLARRWDARGLAMATTPPAAGPYAARRVRAPAPARVRAVGDVLPPRRRAVSADDAGTDLAAARVDALLGLAADAVGLAEPSLADRLLSAAESAALGHRSWRPAVRWYWVRAEWALTVNRPEDAVRYAERANESAERAVAVRHVLKSRLVLAVARSAAGRPAEETVVVLRDLAAHARDTHLRTLEWPIELLLGDLTCSEGLTRSEEHRRRAHQILADIRAKADPYGRNVFDCSPWVPDITDARLLHSDPCHPPETCRLPQSSRMECKISP